MLGTVITATNLMSASNARIMDIRVGDRVEGDGINKVTKLWRGGVQKFPAGQVTVGFVSWANAIKPDGIVVPPPEEPPVDDPNPIPANVLHIELTFKDCVIGPSPRLNGVRYKVDDDQT